jgi:hypothetical protein
MSIDVIQQHVSTLGSALYSSAQTIATLAGTYLGHAVEWLRLQAPAVMATVSLLAEKVATATGPYIAALGELAWEKRDLLGGFSLAIVGVAIGAGLVLRTFSKTHTV